MTDRRYRVLLVAESPDDRESYRKALSRGGDVPFEFAEAHQTIAAIAAGAEDATLLQVARRTPLLEVRRQALGPDGAPLEWSRDRYRGDAFEITIHNQHALPRAGVGLWSAGDGR